MNVPTAKIMIEIPEHVLFRALRAAAVNGLSLDQHIESALAEAEEDEEEPSEFPDLDSALDYALGKSLALPSGTLFEVPDLFTAEQWPAVPSKKWLGRKFKAAVKKDGKVVFDHTTTANHSVFRRK
jgi:hypothetical protein